MSRIPPRPRGSKPFTADELVFDKDGNIDFAETVENHRANRGSLIPDNPPPGPKWQAKQGLARLDLNGAENAVMLCLIDCASKAKGACYPSQEFIQGWTGRAERTVRRAVSTLKRLKLITVIDRGTTSNAYVVAWPTLFKAYRDMKAFERKHYAAVRALRAAPKVAPQSDAVRPEVAPHVRPEVAAKPMKVTYEVKEPMTLKESHQEMASSKKKKEALQEKERAERSGELLSNLRILH